MNSPPPLMGVDLSFEEPFERLQIAFANVGNGPVVEVSVSPMDQVVTFARDDLLRFVRSGRYFRLFGKRLNYSVNGQTSNARVPAEGLEPTRPCGHWILSPARLPIPPRRQIIYCV